MKKNIIIFDFNRTLFNPDEESLFDGALEILDYLSNKSFTLILLGKGDQKRRNKIKALHIEQYFSEIHIVEEKSLSQLEKIANQSGSVVYSIGDRIKKEIKLGNQFGFITIWFKNGKFSEEVPESKEEEPNHTISTLLELKNII